MANHARISKPTGKVTPELVNSLLDGLNQRIFKGNLKVEYALSTKDSPNWGKHTWLVSYISSEDGREYARRVCWSDRTNHFEISHGGGGGDFAWFLDFAVLNEVAVATGAVIKDEGVEEIIPANAGEYDDWDKFAQRNNNGMEKLMELAYKMAPPEFQKNG